MKKLYGTYIGKVIDNNDPEEGGRVRVFCSHPQISNYYASLLTKSNVFYKFPGDEDLSAEFIRVVKPFIPWARIVQPLAGGSAPGKFDAENNAGTRSDSPTPNQTGESMYNPDGYEVTPMEAMRHAEVFDAFAFPEATMTAQGNPYGATDYIGPTYSNKPSGMFNIPRVGSTVALQFINGDLNKPIVVGNAIEKESMQLIMKDGDVPYGMPGDFENV